MELADASGTRPELCSWNHEHNSGTADDGISGQHSKNAPHLSPRSLWGYLYKRSPQRTVVGVPPKKVSNNNLLDPSRKTTFRSTDEIGVSNELH